MISINIAPAKIQLSKLVNSALQGEEVIICNNGKPVVRLVPIPAISEEDPCRVISELTIKAGNEAMKPCDPEDWGDLI